MNKVSFPPSVQRNLEALGIFHSAEPQPAPAGDPLSTFSTAEDYYGFGMVPDDKKRLLAFPLSLGPEWCCFDI